MATKKKKTTTSKKKKKTAPKPIEGLVKPGDKGYPTKLAEMLGGLGL